MSLIKGLGENLGDVVQHIQTAQTLSAVGAEDRTIINARLGTVHTALGSVASELPGIKELLDKDAPRMDEGSSELSMAWRRIRVIGVDPAVEQDIQEQLNLAQGMNMEHVATGGGIVGARTAEQTMARRVAQAGQYLILAAGLLNDAIRYGDRLTGYTDETAEHTAGAVAAIQTYASQRDIPLT
jgi:hypothetical protein